MNEKNSVIIFLYNRLFDPLVQANLWLYIEDYLRSGDDSIHFHVITYEDSHFPITDSQQQLFGHWQELGLSWTPLRWHKGTGFLSKLIDILSGLAIVSFLRTRGFRYVISYGSIASAYAYLYGRLLGLRLFIHTFEPHSEYSVESGMWQRSSFMYKMVHFLERQAAFFAVAIASGTRFMEQRLKNEWRVRGRFFKIPSVANAEKFAFDRVLRDEAREMLGLRPEQWVLFYPGKFGSLYYRAETAWMYRWLRDIEPRLHLLIVTPNADDEVHALFETAGVNRDNYTIVHSDYSEIHRYFFAADFGIIAVPPGPSRKFVSNIKVAEYLCAGLPYLITRGVSEDYLVALEQDVGVVVDRFSEAEIRAAWPEIKRYLLMPADERRRHCREVGLAYRGFATLNSVFRRAMDELLDRRKR